VEVAPPSPSCTRVCRAAVFSAAASDRQADCDRRFKGPAVQSGARLRPKVLPPNYLNATLVLQIVLHFVFPVRQLVRAPYTYLGILLLFFGLAVNVYSVGYLRRMNTTSDFNETADRLVMTGPFRTSRNPIYLSGIVVSLGIATLLGSLITFLLPLLLFLILNIWYVPSEEARLHGIFGNEYLEYKQRVRRWIWN
jgi:protein-S-isoprenylcysteine O-methyltransferase Ste14